MLLSTGRTSLIRSVNAGKVLVKMPSRKRQMPMLGITEDMFEDIINLCFCETSAQSRAISEWPFCKKEASPQNVKVICSD